MEKEHYLLNEVAKSVGRKPYHLAYLLSIGVIEEPSLRIGNKRVFSRQDIDQIREVIRQRAAKARRVAHE
jgi:DNA-binding transcriptional MerR regulator